MQFSPVFLLYQTVNKLTRSRSIAGLQFRKRKVICVVISGAVYLVGLFEGNNRSRKVLPLKYVKLTQAMIGLITERILFRLPSDPEFCLTRPAAGPLPVSKVWRR